MYGESPRTKIHNGADMQIVMIIVMITVNKPVQTNQRLQCDIQIFCQI